MLSVCTHSTLVSGYDSRQERFALCDEGHSGGEPGVQADSHVESFVLVGYQNRAKKTEIQSSFAKMH